MLEFGVAHALMKGIKRIDLNMPMASNAAGAFAEDAMLEDGFMPEDADRARRRAQRQDMCDMVEDMVELLGGCQ